MQIVLFCHSLLSDWNHGNAHFLRGVTGELFARGHDVRVFEPEDAWSVENLIADHGTAPLAEVRQTYPFLRPVRYRMETLDLAETLSGADVVIVHEWNDPELVRRIGEHRACGGRYRLFFHDTHHRGVTDPESMAQYDIGGYDAVLAFGRALRKVYLERRWASRVFVWHEAADTCVFFPRHAPPERDLVWIGNFGDDERTAELDEFLVGPVRTLGLRARVHGVRYPPAALDLLRKAGIEIMGWLPNYRVPEAFAAARATVHVPRRPYVESLPGIPTIRPFEAMACAIPLVCANFCDAERLFSPGDGYLAARDGAEMTRNLASILDRPAAARAMADRGRTTVLSRHTCSHRVDELLRFAEQLGIDDRDNPSPAAEIT